MSDDTKEIRLKLAGYIAGGGIVLSLLLGGSFFGVAAGSSIRPMMSAAIVFLATVITAVLGLPLLVAGWRSRYVRLRWVILALLFVPYPMFMMMLKLAQNTRGFELAP